MSGESSNSAGLARVYDPAEESLVASSPSKSIIVYDDAESVGKIKGLLTNVGFDVAGFDEFDRSRTYALALVNAAADPDFRICKTLSECCKTYLIAEEHDFEFKIKAVHNGAHGLLSSPLNTAELFARLNDGRGANLAEARVLIIDDDELTTAAYAMLLEDCGLNTAIITNPLLADEAIKEFQPDLVVMDIDMPQANGIDVARAIRLEEAFTSLPILFLSAIQSSDIKQRAREIGGDEFIEKPVDVAYLVKMIRMRVGRAIELRDIMVRDSLTGLLNHVTWKESLRAEVNRSKRTGAPFSVALLDLDHFKSVNDRYGHQVGDRVLQTFAAFLQNAVRTVDVIGRYGGEEFAILFLDAKPDALEDVINRIRSEFSKIIFEAGGASFHTTFSCGLVGSESAATAEELITLADVALYQAKANGRDSVCVATDETLPLRMTAEQT